MRIIPLIVLLACVAWQASAQDDGEARAAPSRGLLKRGLLAKGKQTTTTTPAPQEEAEYDEEADYAEGEQQEPSSEAPPSSTEGKKLVVGNRPLRSNADLLETLKKRRAQAAEAKLHGQSSVTSAAASSAAQDTATEAPVKSSYSKKRFNTPAKESNAEEAPASASKPSRGRFGKPATRSIQEADTQEQSESAPVPRAGRAFARRGGN